MIQIFETAASKKSQSQAKLTSVGTNVKWKTEWNGVKWNGMRVDIKRQPVSNFIFYLCFVCNVLVTHCHLSD